MSPANTAGKMSPDEVSQLKTKMQAILFSIEEGMAMVDFEGNILLLNDPAKKMLGIQKRFPYDKKFLDYISNLWVKDKLGALLEAREDALEIELAVPGEQNTLFLKAKKSLVTTADEKILGRVITLRDITLEKQLETLKDDFIQAMTHDLKSPLTSVRGFLKMFLDGEIGPLSKDQFYYLQIMDKASEKVLKLINNILDLAKFESGIMTLTKTEWDAAESVRQTVESLQGFASQQKVKLAAEFSNPGPQKNLARADAGLLERAVTNLLDNAIKFTPARGEVKIRVEDEQGKIKFSVSDTGKGIPAEFLDKIFHKFEQVPGTKGGTGLGLVTAKHIIEAHGGKISVTSQVGTGTTFQFWIPK